MKNILNFIKKYSQFGWLAFAIMYYTHGNTDMATTMLALFVIDFDLPSETEKD
jgi:hypothetical protein